MNILSEFPLNKNNTIYLSVPQLAIKIGVLVKNFAIKTKKLDKHNN